MQAMIEKHLELALVEFTNEKFYDALLAAKEFYFSKTGKIDDEDDDFESKMKAFNEWYLLQYHLPSGKTPIQEYLVKHELDPYLTDLFSSVVFSVYEFSGLSFFRKSNVLRDLYNKTKIRLALDVVLPVFLKNDLFVGRTLSHGEEHFLLPGVVVVPRGVKRLISRRARQVRKLNDAEVALDFIYKVIYFKNKWKRYRHVKASRIFNFNQ